MNQYLAFVCAWYHHSYLLLFGNVDGRLKIEVVHWHSLNILFLPTFHKFRFLEIEIWTLVSKVTVWKLKLPEMLSGYSELLDNNLISKPGVF